MWPTRMPSLDATSAAAKVEFTSPGTRTTSGSVLLQDRARCCSITRAVCTAWLADPTDSITSGRRRRAPRGRSVTWRRRSAGPYAPACGVPRVDRRCSAAITGTVFMKFGRAPTTDRTWCSRPTALYSGRRGAAWSLTDLALRAAAPPTGTRRAGNSGPRRRRWPNVLKYVL